MFIAYRGGSPNVLAKTSISKIHPIFLDEKQAKAVLAAAKRVVKKRSSGEHNEPSSAKRPKASSSNDFPPTPASIEASLTLPSTEATDDEIASATLHTNRAPLVLAFAVTLLRYTMPSQPLSSRLSLAQAVVSVNSRSKAVSLGLVKKGTGAEDEGWGLGQPCVTVMGREVKVMRRHGYEWRVSNVAKEGRDSVKEETPSEDANSQVTLQQEVTSGDDDPALWGLDLEALRTSNGPLVARSQSMNGTGLPIYSADNARAYLCKSFASSPADAAQAGSPSKKSSAAAEKAQKEENLAKLLRALDLLYASWAHVLAKDELDRRAWSWYVAVRPDVKEGVAGWGGRGEVKLGKILQLRRES
ncbi:MAG: hypothetical protein Q9163_004970 [Psora crenata]